MARHPIFTAEPDELRASVRRFVDRELRPHVEEWEEAGRFPDRVFRRAGELGFLGLHYPERWAARVATWPPSSSSSRSSRRPAAGRSRWRCRSRPTWRPPRSSSSAPTTRRSGTSVPPSRAPRSRRSRSRSPTRAPTWPRSRPGRCATATSGGSPAASCSSPTAPGHDFLTLVATTDPDAGHHGISLFLVDTDRAGLSVSRTLRKLGMWSSDTAEIALDDVAVPHTNLIGLEPGHGFAQLMVQLQYERLAGAAASVGSADAALARTVAYARERRAFGQPIGRHQVIAHHLADAATELEAARSLLYTTAWRVQQGEYPVAEISMTKKYCAQVQNRLVDTCVQVFGGAGYLHEEPISRAFRDARLQRIGGGTDEIMNEVIAKHLLGGPSSGPPDR